nr:hypothetical protein [Tanacetum cinerariifolium]
MIIPSSDNTLEHFNGGQDMALPPREQRYQYLRLCHRLIACSIAGRSQAPEKGLTIIALALLVIDMAELVRLQICEQLDDTWAWVALGPERQLDAAASAPGREVIDAMAHDFSIFSTWAVTSLARMMNKAVITEYLVNISKRHAFWNLIEDILKITILKINMPYPSRKIRRIRACTHQRPQRKQDQYAVSVGNKMHKAFPLPGESFHWQYKFPLPVNVVPTARRLEMPLPGVCAAIEEMMKKLPVKDRWQKARIAQSSALPTVADEPASPVRDDSQGEACPTDSGFIADQDRATIAKSSTLPHDSAPRVTSPAADEGSMQQHISELTALCTSLQRQYSELMSKFQAQEEEIGRLKKQVQVLEDREAVATKQSGEDAPIKGRSNNEGEAAAERIRETNVPTGSGFIPTAGPHATVISTGSEAPEKVTGVDLFYLRSIDQETANVPHLLARDQGLRGLSVVTRELPLLDLHELGILNIYERIGDMWAWVASRPERQSDAAAGAPGAAEDAPAVDKGAQADLAPVQAPQPPPPTPKTMQQRISKLEEEVQELRRSIVGLRG